MGATNTGNRKQRFATVGQTDTGRVPNRRAKFRQPECWLPQDSPETPQAVGKHVC
ncbi:hypothetical protein MKJ04_20100 [Pontibacter sp. E15-1]|uniref:hypothetical protein n=1 Tax=Pontibacter sp. E15-1 TaxID=2919918 RepID=UPI001F4F4189|nr:hypothetical protein [Pontibacter sp. E15-1]MCJ8167154.1 hypothetical protein [Pontibacter sp. E15-1]